MAPTEQYELDHTDHTDHTDQESIYLSVLKDLDHQVEIDGLADV